MSNIARDPYRAPSRHDPLAAQRQDGGPELDVFLTGTVFFDIIFIGMEGPPKQGTEVWADGMGSSPGGVANLAVAAARLGLRTGLAATFGETSTATTAGRRSASRRASISPTRATSPAGTRRSRCRWSTSATAPWSPTGTSPRR